VLCTGRALPPHSSPPFAASLGSPMAPARPPMAPPPAGRSRGHPHGHAPRHRHRGRVRHPPPFHQLPIGRRRLARSSRSPTRPPEAHRICRSGAKWLRLRPLLRGVVRTYRTTGNEAPASARRRGCQPWRHHMGVLCRWHPAGAEHRPM
jgi:hypothetical protein